MSTVTQAFGRCDKCSQHIEMNPSTETLSCVASLFGFAYGKNGENKHLLLISEIICYTFTPTK